MIKGKWAGGKKKDEMLSPVKKASVIAWLKEPKSMDRSNEAQQLKATLLSVARSSLYIRCHYYNQRPQELKYRSLARFSLIYKLNPYMFNIRGRCMDEIMFSGRKNYTPCKSKNYTYMFKTNMR